jgi:hypothetical protein
MRSDLLEASPLELPSAPRLVLSVPEAKEKKRHHLGIYLLVLLPLIVTLLFVVFQLTPWGDACPPEAPCITS